MALFLGSVSSWQADSWKRVSGTSTTYLLNTNEHMADLRVTSGTADNGNVSLYYFDNPWDHRDSGDYMVITSSSLNAIIATMDIAYGSNSMTVNHFLDNDNTHATESITFPTANFAWAVARDASTSWLYYNVSGYDSKKILVNHTLIQLAALVA